MAFSRLFCCQSCEKGEALLTFAEVWGANSTEFAPLPYSGSGKVQGLFSILWCPHCIRVSPFILVRLSPPADHPVVAYAEAQSHNLTGYETGVCYCCNQKLQATAEGAPCSACQTGELSFIGEWEDAT